MPEFNLPNMRNLVPEITQDELGTLRIGTNRTDYAWDGKDEYGDQLANGVYLYRVITKRDGAQYENYSNRTDYMFRQGFGKMYLTVFYRYDNSALSILNP